MTLKQSSIFSNTAKPPLADRMRPCSLEEIQGQEEVIGPKSVFGQIIRDRTLSLPSVLLVGPPGTGKTTIGRVIAKESGYKVVELSGVLDGVKELRDAVARAREDLESEGKRTLAIVDEIHRFNRSQQDAFLPHVENGLLTVVGLTTENVSFRLRNALLSRMRVIELQPLGAQATQALVENALQDSTRGLGEWRLSLADDALELLVQYSNGDGRRALTALEWSATEAHFKKKQLISKEDIRASFGNQPLPFDQKGDYHYDLISAFIKSMRGSDPDAALYYMVRALEGGEDPHFLSRRMIIFASEDVSCDPRALPLAIAADQAVERVGLPEARINLAHVAVYLACAPKSNASYKALRELESLVQNSADIPVPRRLRNAPTELMKDMGNTIGYHYPHDFEGGFYPESYLPEKLQGQKFYKPSARGIEIQIKEKLEHYEELIKKNDN